MLITGGDSSGTLSVVGSDDDGAPLVEHLSSSLLRDLRKFLSSSFQVDKIDPDWPKSCTMQVHLKVFPCVFFFLFLFLFWRKISRKK